MREECKQISISTAQWNESFSIVKSLLSSFDKFDLKFLNKTVMSFKHELIDYFVYNFNYNKFLLKLCSWLMDFNNIDFSKINMNNIYWECMEFRIQNISFRVIIEDFLKEVDSLEDMALNKLKNASKSLLTCYKCNKNQVSVLFLPCGHFIICSLCFDSNILICGNCRVPITEHHFVFL